MESPGQSETPDIAHLPSQGGVVEGAVKEEMRRLWMYKNGWNARGRAAAMLIKMNEIAEPEPKRPRLPTHKDWSFERYFFFNYRKQQTETSKLDFFS